MSLSFVGRLLDSVANRASRTRTSGAGQETRPTTQASRNQTRRADSVPLANARGSFCRGTPDRQACLKLLQAAKNLRCSSSVGQFGPYLGKPSGIGLPTCHLQAVK